jgi:hypothetical protein
MQRTLAAYTVAASLILTLGVPAAETLTAHTRLAHATRPADRVSSTSMTCARWA